MTIDHLIGIDSTVTHQLSEFQQLYQAKDHHSYAWNDELISVLDYVIKNPALHEQLQAMQQLPIKKQKAVHRILKSIINESERL